MLIDCYPQQWWKQSYYSGLSTVFSLDNWARPCQKISQIIVQLKPTLCCSVSFAEIGWALNSMKQSSKVVKLVINLWICSYIKLIYPEVGQPLPFFSSLMWVSTLHSLLSHKESRRTFCLCFKNSFCSRLFISLYQSGGPQIWDKKVGQRSPKRCKKIKCIESPIACRVMFPKQKWGTLFYDSAFRMWIIYSYKKRNGKVQHLQTTLYFALASPF